MPRLTDLAEVRARLETDRRWSVYALGDLTPPLSERAEWYGLPGVERAVLLIYRGFARPVLFCLGSPASMRPLLEEIAGEPELYLLVRPDVLPVIKSHYRVEQEFPMWRMTLEAVRFHPEPGEAAARLGPADLAALQALYIDGAATGEAPDFFDPASLESGVYFGIWEGGSLIAAAGTHLVSAPVSVAAVGNVYTRRDRRGRGLASRVTRAVTADLLRMRLRTIALNVSQHNAAAERVYARLGYARYCDFYEGLALRK